MHSDDGGCVALFECSAKVRDQHARTEKRDREGEGSRSTRTTPKPKL